LHRPASVAVPDAIVGRGKIVSQPHPETKSLLVNLGDFFLRDLEGVAPFMKAVFQAPYQVDKEGSSFVSLRTFPENLDIKTSLHVFTPEVRRPLVYAADSRSLLIQFHYSIAPLPDTGFRPRLADDRVGHFLAMMGDYTDDRPDDPTVRYVTRWHLEKKDPSAPLSEPKEPIVFYLEDSIPEEYRDAVRAGILGWNPAFESLGFENAMVAKEQPDDPDWDAADARYSTIRWIVAPHAGFAIGPSRINPYTGQIFDADIAFSADMLRYVRRQSEELVAPVTSLTLPGLPVNGLAEQLQSLGSWASLLGPVAGEIRQESYWKAAGRRGLTLGAGARPGTSPAAMRSCNLMQGISHELGLGWNLLAMRGLADAEMQDRYVHDFIVHVTLHEVGHTLGLRHNFKASMIHSLESLQDEELARRVGLTGSVMDYTPANLAPEGQPQRQFFQTVIGPYDRLAIEYAYEPIDSETIEGEREELNRIAARAAEAQNAYGTDEDAYVFLGAIDPTANIYDLGSDLIQYSGNRIAIARELFGKMEDRFSEPGTRYQKLLQVFGQGLTQYAIAVLNVPKFIGGIHHYRDHIGDPNGRVPYVPVPADQQRAALRFLTREILGPDTFRLPPRLLNKLAIERFEDIEGTLFMRRRNDLPLHDLVLLIQSIPLSRIYDPITLSRINDLAVRYSNGDEPFTMAEMFGDVRAAIWQELASKENVNSFRRNLQRHHLQTLIGMVVEMSPGIPEDARTLARADLERIRREINALLGRPERPLPPEGAALNAVSRAHLRETRARITAALEAGLERQMPRPAGVSG
jgi:hypothetical protein